MTSETPKEVLLMVGRFMSSAISIVKVLIFDGHNAHGYLRECLMGWFEKVDRTWLEGLEFWGDLEYRDLPQHCLPRLPMRLAFHSGEAVSCIAAPCDCVALRSHVIPCESSLTSFFLFWASGILWRFDIT